MLYSVSAYCLLQSQAYLRINSVGNGSIYINNILSYYIMLYYLALQLRIVTSSLIINCMNKKTSANVAMGSPFGPSFANIFMCTLEQNFLSNCPLHCKPLIYRGYVDDTFYIFQKKVQAENFLLYLNQQHHNISFTHEFEVNTSLPFVDVLIAHTDKSFSFNLY